MEDIIIVDAVRSAVGRAIKGSLAQKRPDELAGDVIRGLLARYDIDYLVLGTEDGALRDYCAASLDTCELTFRNATYDLGRIRRPQPQPRA